MRWNQAQSKLMDLFAKTLVTIILELMHKARLKTFLLLIIYLLFLTLTLEPWLVT